jgi:HK97 family phage major capsid protein
MSLYAQLLERKRVLGAEENGIIAAVEAAGGVFAPEQRARLDAIHKEFDASAPESLAADIAREEARKARDRQAPALPEAGALVIEPVISSASDKSPLPFRTLGEQMQAVAAAAIAAKHGGAPDPRLVAIMDHAAAEMKAVGPSGAGESVGADGGFTVQKDFSNDLLKKTFDTGVLTSRATHVPIGAQSNGLIANVIDETSRVDGSRYGAVLGYWLPEAAALTGSRPKFRRIEIQLSKLIGLFYATDELLQDNVALGAVAELAFTDEFGFKLDDAMIEGTGAGMPLGILNSPALVTVTKETGQSAATIVSENIMKMYTRMFPRGLTKGDAAWFINQECWPQIFALSIAVGTGGVPMFVPQGQFSSSPNGSLLGRPIIPIEQASALGSVGDIILADWNDYTLIEKGGIQTASSIHVLFLTDEMTFRWVLRTNGQPNRVKPITPFKGSATLSSFVVLAAR